MLPRPSAKVGVELRHSQEEFEITAMPFEGQGQKFDGDKGAFSIFESAVISHRGPLSIGEIENPIKQF
jgi:hypothetical protein